MAQERARPTRARTTKDKKVGEKGVPKATRSTRTSRKAVETTPDAVATLAYLMWERGDPGDATTHWLRAEQELAA